jgi:hypothetical protein
VVVRRRPPCVTHPTSIDDLRQHVAEDENMAPEEEDED